MRELTVRALSGFLYVIILLFSIFYSEKWYILLFLLFGIITLREFLRLIGFQFWYTYLILIGFVLFFSYFKISKPATLVLLVFTVCTGLYLMKNLFSEKIRKYNKLQKLHITIFYIIASFVFLTLLPTHGDEFSPYTVAGLFVLIWTNDTFATNGAAIAGSQIYGHGVVSNGCFAGSGACGGAHSPTQELHSLDFRHCRKF